MPRSRPPAVGLADWAHHWLTALEACLAEAAADPRLRPGAALHARGGRTPLFYLQGLGRIGAATGPRRAFWADLRLQAKRIEDLLGVYDAAQDLAVRAAAWGLSPPLVRALEDAQARALGALELGLRWEGWWTVHEGQTLPAGPAAPALRERLAALPRARSGRDRAALVDFLAETLRETRARLQDGRLDLGQIEAGVHELRRRLRWLPIYALATRGKILLDPAPARGALARYATESIVASPFNQLPVDPDLRRPVYLHRGGFYALSHLIAAIGPIKDQALRQESLVAACAALGLDPGPTLAPAAADLQDPAAVTAAVQDLVDAVIVRDGALDALIDHLDAQR